VPVITLSQRKTMPLAMRVGCGCAKVCGVGPWQVFA